MNETIGPAAGSELASTRKNLTYRKQPIPAGQVASAARYLTERIKCKIKSKILSPAGQVASAARYLNERIKRKIKSKILSPVGQVASAASYLTPGGTVKIMH